MSHPVVVALGGFKAVGGGDCYLVVDGGGGRSRGMPYHSPLNMIDGMSSLEGCPSKSFDIPSHTGFGNNSYRHFEPTTSGSHMQFGSPYSRNTLASFPDDIGWRYSTNNNDPYSTHKFPGGSNLGEQF
ncbi:hypothetical protein Patl1_04077 [Pistacia atlantica]|uniref:Uncharacterized protein n=1 Tax=Pistacia atlantica TaxID=434234 RepID=A0ACC1BPV5_9ROSI|nr:hypothetical protein Patl1_04077 [Pistacia atlantica]